MPDEGRVIAVPIEFHDWLIQSGLSPKARQTLEKLFVIWDPRRGDLVEASLSQLTEHTGMARSTQHDAVRELVVNKIVRRYQESGQADRFDLGPLFNRVARWEATRPLSEPVRSSDSARLSATRPLLGPVRPSDSTRPLSGRNRSAPRTPQARLRDREKKRGEA